MGPRASYLAIMEKIKFTDERLLKESIEKPALFSELVERYEKQFFRKAVSILRNSEDAEDAVQETFVKIYRFADSFEEGKDRSFSSWAYSILINTSITFYNKQKKKRERSTALSDELEAVTEDKGALRMFEEYIEKDYIKFLLKKLPLMLRRTMSLYAFRGLSMGELAREEHVTEGVVRTRLFRARELLKKYLKEGDYDK